MNSAIKEIEASLQRELTEYDNQSCQMKRDLKVIEEGRKRIAAALSALGAKTVRAQRSKECCTKDEVSEIIKTILQQNVEVPQDDLIALAKEKITASGKSLSGFSLRLKEVLRSNAVHECQPGIYSLPNRDNLKNNTKAIPGENNNE